MLGRSWDLPARDDVTQGESMPRIVLFDEVSGDCGDQIRGDGLGFLPVPGFRAVGFVFHADETAVRDGDPAAGNRENHFGCGAVVRVIVERNVIAGVFGLALRPNLAGLLGIIAVRKDEVDAFLRLTFVADVDFAMVAAVCGMIERDHEFFRIDRRIWRLCRPLRRFRSSSRLNRARAAKRCREARRCFPSLRPWTARWSRSNHRCVRISCSA